MLLYRSFVTRRLVCLSVQRRAGTYDTNIMNIIILCICHVRVSHILICGLIGLRSSINNTEDTCLKCFCTCAVMYSMIILVVFVEIIAT